MTLILSSGPSTFPLNVIRFTAHQTIMKIPFSVIGVTGASLCRVKLIPFLRAEFAGLIFSALLGPKNLSLC